MIGGEDIVLRGKPRPDDWDSIVRYLSRAWPDAILEDASGAEPMPIRSLWSRTPSPTEFFVYRNEHSFQSWQQKGATDNNGEDLIHVLIGNHEITWVIDRRDSWSGRLVLQLMNALERKRRQIVEPLSWAKKRLHDSRRAAAE